MVFDKTGKRLKFLGREERVWRFNDDKPIVSDWSFKQDGLPEVALHHEWQMNNEGVLQATIKQYDKMERGTDEEVKYGKLVREGGGDVENFNSVSWIVSQDDKQRVVALFDLNLWKDKNDPVEMGKYPISSSRLTVYDNKGNLWASGLEIPNDTNYFYSVSTHQGTVYLSFRPFKGSNLVGNAEKNRIKIEDGKLKLTIESADLLVPRGVVAKVYAKIDLANRTEGMNRVRSNSSSDEKHFLNPPK